MMFWERFCELCQQRDMTPTQVVKDAGIAAGSVTKWKNGSIPHGQTRQKIADYFCISEKELFEPSPEKKKPVAISDELWEALQNNPDVLAVCEEIVRNPEMLQVFKAIKERRDGV